MMMLENLRNLIAFIITLGILITVHEYGHFLAARCLRIKVAQFSIGFGPVIWSWKSVNGTEYTISIILLGGYVKLFDIDNDNKICSIDKKFKSLFRYRSIWQRGWVIINGPIFNFIFSILLYTIVYSIGVPVHKPVITYVLPNSIAYQANIPAGSQIKAINDIDVHNWDEVRLQILNNINKEKIIISTVFVNGNNAYLNAYDYDAFLPINWFNRSVIDSQDPIILFGFLPNIINIKEIVLQKENYIFEKQNNLKVNDKILLINHQPIYNLEFLNQTIKNHPNRIFTITIDRDQQILDIDLVLAKTNLNNLEELTKRINLFLNTITMSTSNDLSIKKYTLYSAILQAINKTYTIIYSIINVLVQLIFGNIKIINIHGPIAIAQGAGKSVHFGIIYYLMFLAVVSINLGIINLLPIPILDGGQLFFLLIEKIVTQRILKKLKNLSYIVSFTVLILVMFIALYNDITAWFK